MRAAYWTLRFPPGGLIRSLLIDYHSFFLFRDGNTGEGGKNCHWKSSCVLQCKLAGYVCVLYADVHVQRHNFHQMIEHFSRCVPQETHAGCAERYFFLDVSGQL